LNHIEQSPAMRGFVVSAEIKTEKTKGRLISIRVGKRSELARQ